MKEWRSIRSAIYNALSGYDCSVYYQKPVGKGWNGTCGYFEITIEDEYDSDEIEEELQSVADDWELDFDWDSDGTVDLNAYWDRRD